MHDIDASAVTAVPACKHGATHGVAGLSVRRSEKPLATALVVDCSSSMMARSEVHRFVAALVHDMDGADRLRIFTFGSDTRSNGWATVGMYRRALLLWQLRRFARSERRPPCLADDSALGAQDAGAEPTDAMIEAWANQCTADELRVVLDEAITGFLRGAFLPRGPSGAGAAIAEALIALVSPAPDGFIPAYDARSGLVIVSDFDILAPSADVLAHAAALRSAFLLQQWDVSVRSLPNGVPAGGRSMWLAHDSAPRVAGAVVTSLRAVHEASFDITGTELTRSGCVELAYSSAGIGHRVIQPEQVVPPRDVLLAALHAAGDVPADGVLRQLVGRSRGAMTVLGRTVPQDAHGSAPP